LGVTPQFHLIDSAVGITDWGCVALPIRNDDVCGQAIFVGVIAYLDDDSVYA
jgi:hypothetical protein